MHKIKKIYWLNSKFMNLYYLWEENDEKYFQFYIFPKVHFDVVPQETSARKLQGFWKDRMDGACHGTDNLFILG